MSTTTVSEIRTNAELRLRELQQYVDEAEQLRQIIALLDEQPARPAARSNGNGARRSDTVREAPAEGTGLTARAPQGANKRRILDIVLKRPGITASEIARETGLKRTVVASTISRLKRTGELESDGRGACVPVERTAEVLALVSSS
jgi:predicted transcriptional regulator